MSRVDLSRCLAVVLLWLGCVVAARADYACPDGADTGIDDRRLRNAEAAAAEGRHGAAFDLLKAVDTACLEAGGDAAQKRFVELMEATGRSLGKPAEQASKYRQALGIYQLVRTHAGAYTEPDEDRAYMGIARSERTNRRSVEEVHAYFVARLDELAAGVVRTQGQAHQQARQAALAGYLKETQALASVEGDKFLVAEAAAFGKGAMMGYPVKDIEEAKEWFSLGPPGAVQKAIDRAMQRGNSLIAENGRPALKGAIAYFDAAGDAGRVQAVRDKATQLAEAAAAKGDNVLAADYFEIAGLSDAAQQALVNKEAADAERREAFEAGSDDLEKELGF